MKPMRTFLLLTAQALLLAGCSLAGGNKESATIYAPDARVTPDPAWPQVTWQLALTKPSATRMIDSPRIAVRPTPDELQVYSGVSWAQPATDMFEDTLLRAFEDSGRIPGVARLGTGIGADYKLLLDLRRFESDYAGHDVPAATIELNAKLLHTVDQRVVSSHTFLVTQTAGGTTEAQVVDAFGQALSQLSRAVVGWTLQQGQADAASTVAPPTRR
ncbi:ABC-type transport auxiliary lipoprotein family protein [Xanthomonas albilineans]|uniref:Putative secreted protein n=1 Tax=Xanthomonas albilineans (strain GPE PC73 / CFBP 7063) TaxID=380358 RepID=D2UFK2_XANAP|nr:ABC-type transport auxiliary lipoprotein family protein [Xanthomonas albilineans]PPU94115.1 ABC transporter [Xanthomonas albilineans]QHQ29412.1 putative secreted protein [Xanthomonas albilineans]CBA17163.1 putative secreted protein [Xanthomonas albilineans GPE PC73]